MKTKTKIIGAGIVAGLAGAALWWFSHQAPKVEPRAEVVTQPVRTEKPEALVPLVTKPGAAPAVPAQAAPVAAAPVPQAKPVAVTTSSAAPASVTSSPAPVASAAATPPPESKAEELGTARMYAAHAALRVPEVADPDSKTNRQILQTMVSKALARQASQSSPAKNPTH
ncbi:MAG TPA: hypothetical protein VFJ90_01305 [Candidatus Didemnitutus sp.]|nr:hypothetical protein [Candidatus Didemnitutus sp.]